ncbi:MAG: FliA/WhiG family RNA polymerase sigma factor [Firmicutes bacterium]|nr:FliA/WhiG family RNA polymerase sigma factor [Bacillota bacterium]
MSNVDLWQRYNRSRDDLTRQELVVAYLDLVKHLSGRLSIKLPPCMSKEDLESCGIIGLMEAIDKYNPDLDIAFEVFAYRRIRGAMYDELRKTNWIPRTTWQKLNYIYAERQKLEQAKGRSVSDQELALEINVPLHDIHTLNNHLTRLTPLSLDGAHMEDNNSNSIQFADILPDSSSPDPVQEICAADDKETLIEAIKLLNDRDQLILALYYQEELTLKEIGEVLEITESRVCQLHSRAIIRLRKKLAQLSGE